MTRRIRETEVSKSVPNLRFPEFTDEWKECELKDIAIFSKGAGISKDQLSETGESCILYGELYTKYKSEVISNVISKTDIENSNLVWSKANDVIIPSSGETAIDISTARCVPYDNILLGGDLNIIRLKDQDGRFFSYQLNGVRKLDIAQIAQGVSVVHLYGESLKRLKVRYPSKSEQEKISSLLSVLDERIETQNRIIKELKLYRNALIFRLLTPKDKWIRLSIGDVAHVIGGGTPDTNIEDYWNGNIQWFTPSEIGKEKYVTESERTLTQKGLDNSSAKILPPNTILLSTRATIGECSIAKQECCTNQGFQSLIANKVTPEFLYYLIQTKKKDLLSKASGSTFAEISANEVRKIHICIPGTQEEQKAIVQPLSAYDEKIETECKILHLSSLFHFLCALILYTVSNDYIMTYLRGAKFRKIEKGDKVWT